ncbi:MAG: DUF692 domain-containing protein [Bdellovibrionia bacterium]
MRDKIFKNLGFGAGFRRSHRERILDSATQLEWFEVISENYFGMGAELVGPEIETLTKLRAKYPVALHGVSLSIGSTDPLNLLYLKKLKNLTDRIEPAMVSDHLCWTGVGGYNMHDLLPLPYTREALEHVVSRVSQVQDHLGRRIMLENVSSYVTYTHSEMDEWDFLVEVAEKADCGILLDVNNIYVSSRNHGFDPKKYVDRIPMHRVGQMHLAGYSDEGTHLIDTHDHAVSDAVWDLYKYTRKKSGAVSTMVEWDDHIPSFETLENEVLKARTFAEDK